MNARRWIALAAAGLLSIAIVPAVSMAKTHIVAKPIAKTATHKAVAAKKVVKKVVKKPTAKKTTKKPASKVVHKKAASKSAPKKAASKKPVKHAVTKKTTAVKKSAAKPTAAVIPPAPAMF